MAPLTSPDSTWTPEIVLEQGLRRWYDRPVRIAALRHVAMDGFSTNPVTRLEVMLDSGERLPVIFKRFLRKPARDIALEVRLYGGVLANQRFDAPALYAAVCDDPSGACWLFLEDVGDWRLEYCKTEVWEAAFRWLAGLHAAWYGREAELAAQGYLPEHDAAFYRSLAGFARQTLTQRGTPEALARFDQLMARGLERASAELGATPRTLLHGDFSCHNVMVQAGDRIRTIDWEWAAIGVPAWDVVRLLDGWGEAGQRLLATYLDAVSRQVPSGACHSQSVIPSASEESRSRLPGSQDSSPERSRMGRNDNQPATSHSGFDHEAFERSLPHCRVMLKLWRIGWWARACQEPGGLDRHLASIEAIWAETGSEAADA